MERVDVTGEVCPRPALIVRRELAALDPGETLVVRGDYPPAERNLRRTCRTHGFEVTAAADLPAESDAVVASDGSGGDGNGDGDGNGGGDGNGDGGGGGDGGGDGFELAITVTDDASLAEE